MPSPDGKSTYEGVRFVTADTLLPTSSTTYYARWRELVDVGWHTNDGNWDVGGYYYRSTSSLWGAPVNPISNAVVRTGYEFLGWSTDQSATEPEELATKVTAPLTYYAVWKAHEHELTLDANGGSWPQSTASPPTVTATYDAFLPTDDGPLPTWPGHKFLGYKDTADDLGYWYYGANEVGTAVAGPAKWDKDSAATLYAQWEVIPYPISYDLRGGRFPDDVAIPREYTYDSPDVPLVRPIRDGYHFTGWLDADNQDAEPVLDFVIPTHSWGERGFIATWKAVTYQIEFDMGLTDAAWEPDGQGALPQNPMAATFDQPITMPRAPKRAGYLFKGWGQLGVHTTPGGSQETVVKRTFEPGKAYSVNLAQAEGATVILTGLWERNLAATVPVAVDLRLFANYGTGQFEVGAESDGSDVGTFENRSSGELKVTGMGEMTDDGAFAQERQAARLEAFGSAANLAQVSLTLQPLDAASEPAGTRAQLPLGGSTQLAESPDDQGLSYAPGWRMGPGERLAAIGFVVGLNRVFGLDTGALQVHQLKSDVHKPMAKLSYELALVNP